MCITRYYYIRMQINYYYYYYYTFWKITFYSTAWWHYNNITSYTYFPKSHGSRGRQTVDSTGYCHCFLFLTPSFFKTNEYAFGILRSLSNLFFRLELIFVLRCDLPCPMNKKRWAEIVLRFDFECVTISFGPWISADADGRQTSRLGVKGDMCVFIFIFFTLILPFFTRDGVFCLYFFFFVCTADESCRMVEVWGAREDIVAVVVAAAAQRTDGVVRYEFGNEQRIVGM